MKQNITILMVATLLLSCGSKTDETPQHEAEPSTEVITVNPTRGHIERTLELLATTEYLRHWAVSAPVSAYVTATYAQKGLSVRAGQTLFLLETKERQALGSDMLASHDLGRITLKAPQSGVVTDVLQQPGCYVQEGAMLAQMADAGSLVFRLDVPYEDMRYVRHGRKCQIALPDGTTVNATIDCQLSSMTETSQSLQVYARGKAPFLPEGMNVRVLLNADNGNTAHWLLPRAAVQSNEQMTEFWIMKVGSNGRAERINVTTGNSDDNRIEILSPALNAADRVITSGAYGLDDNSRITIAE